MRIVSSNFFSHVPYRILTSNENCCLKPSVRPINNRARDYIFLKTIKKLLNLIDFFCISSSAHSVTLFYWLINNFKNILTLI